MQCADVVPLHGQGGQWTLNRHIRDETNFVNTVPVSVMQVPGKMSIAGTSYYLASEQLQVFKTYILYICKESDFLVRGCTPGVWNMREPGNLVPRHFFFARHFLCKKEKCLVKFVKHQKKCL